MKKSTFFYIIALLFVFSCGKKNENGILFEDDFSNASSLKNWEIIDCQEPSDGPSEWTVTDDGQLLQNSNIYRSDKEYEMFEGTKAVTKTGKDWTNYEFSCDFKIHGDDDGVGVVFRYQDPEHYYRFITVQDETNHGPFRLLQKKDGDKYITLDADNENGYDAASTHKIKIVANGDELKVYMDGKEILSAKDDTYKNGKIGLMSYAEQPAFDNVVVKGL